MGVSVTEEKVVPFFFSVLRRGYKWRGGAALQPGLSCGLSSRLLAHGALILSLPLSLPLFL